MRNQEGRPIFGFTLLEVLIASFIAILIAGVSISVLHSGFRILTCVTGKENDRIEEDQILMKCQLIEDIQCLLRPTDKHPFSGTANSLFGDRLQSSLKNGNNMAPTFVSWETKSPGHMIRKQVFGEESSETPYSASLRFEYSIQEKEGVVWKNLWISTNSLPSAIRFIVNGETTTIFVPLSFIESK